MKIGSYKISWRDVGRWILHIPVGAVIAFLVMMTPSELGGPAIGIVVAVTFFLYEVLEDWRIKDRSFKDVFGSLIAMIAAAFAILYFVAS